MRKFLYSLALGILAASPVIGAETLIQKQPEGTLHDNMMRSGMGYYYAMSATLPTDVAGLRSSVVVGNNGDFYIKNPFSQIQTGTWLKGTIDSEGNVIVSTPQYIYRDIDGTKIEDLYAMRMVPSDIPGNFNFTKDSQESDLKFTWKDGVLTQVGGGALGLCTIDGEFWGYADSDIVMSTFNGVPVAPSNPESLNFSDFIIGFNTNYEVPDAVVAKVAFSGDDVWIKDFMPEIPDAWVHGKKVGTDLVFDSEQYLGIYREEGSMYYAFFYGASTFVDKNHLGVNELMYKLEDSFTMYEGSRGYRSEDVFMINSGNTISRYIVIMNEPEMETFNDMPRTPMTPMITTNQPPSSADMLPIGMFSFALDPLDEEGHFIDPTKLYYRIYLNDDNNPLTLTPTQFPGFITEKTIDIPYYFDDSPMDFEWSILFFFNEINLIYQNESWRMLGAQSVYKGGGEVRTSPINYGDLNPVYPDPDPDPFGGVDDINGNDVEIVGYYDMMGNSIKNPASGMYIVKYSNGKTAKKVIR